MELKKKQTRRVSFLKKLSFKLIDLEEYLFIITITCCLLTACGTRSNCDYDHPEPTYMDTVAGISLQNIHSISFHVAPLSCGWVVSFANGEIEFASYDKIKRWRFRNRTDTIDAYPLTGQSSAFLDRYGIAEYQLAQIMDFCRNNHIPLLCGPTVLRWEKKYASAIYEYSDDTLHEELLLFGTICDSIRFKYNIETKEYCTSKSGYAHLSDCTSSYLEYLQDEGFRVTIRFSADTLQCLSVCSGSESDNLHNPYLNSLQPMAKK